MKKIQTEWSRWRTLINYKRRLMKSKNPLVQIEEAWHLNAQKIGQTTAWSTDLCIHIVPDFVIG